MAARSPVTIESSPPYETYRPPSITPESRSPSANTASVTRSSPNLLSPSAFVRSRPQPLKSGSRKQQVPAGANTGFASATSIWKVQSELEHAERRTLHGEEDGDRGHRGQEPLKRTVKTKGTEKLARPKKNRVPGMQPVTGTTEDPEVRCDSFLNLNETRSAGLVDISQPVTLDEGTPSGDNVAYRRPSINLSEYSFDAKAALAEVPAPSKPAPARKKLARKRASKTTDEKRMSPPKPTWRPKAKSEAIILDSDEPEEMVLEATAGRQSHKDSMQPPHPKAASNANCDDKTLSHGKLQSIKTKRVSASTPKDGPEKSAYFTEPIHDIYHLPSSPPPPMLAPTKGISAPGSPHNEATTTNTAADDPALLNDLAPRRRRSWTPAKESHNVLEANSFSPVQPAMNEGIGSIPFSEMLGNFSYLQPDDVPTRRTASGEESTKRRRLELREAHQPSPRAPPEDCQSRPQPQPAPKTAKRPKASKKAQTITALATAAYHLPVEAEPAQSTVSAFFGPRKEGVDMDTGSKPDAQSAEPAKAKKVRKPRAKTTNPKGDGVPSEPTKARKSKPKKKIKIDPKDYQPPLQPPSQASKQIRSQEFLFGTSSQLAAEEPPEFIRDLQAAVQQSEVADAMPSGSNPCTQLDASPLRQNKSCAKVPTAPHGTCLSVEQAARELWCVSARDEDGSKLPQEPKSRLDTGACAESPREVAAGDIPASAIVLEHNSPVQQTAPEHAVSPTPLLPCSKHEVSSVEERNLAGVAGFQRDTDPDLPESVERKAPAGKDDWVLLQSDDSTVVPYPTTSERVIAPTSFSPRRTALKPLDANINLPHYDALKAVTSMQDRSFSTTTSKLGGPGDTGQKKPEEQSGLTSPRGRGRPRKHPLVDQAAKTSPTRGRGRPRKHPLVEGDSKTPPLRGRGRPRKEPTSDDILSTSPKRSLGRPRNQTGSVSPPRSRHKGRSSKSPRSDSRPLPAKEWTNIDDISESDSPATPSPRRRRASASPFKVRSLEFAPPASLSGKAKATTSATLAIKATDPAWPSIQAKIYPQIADTIRSEPSSVDVKAPSWHEKILLYDPIVLEDLSAWLNSRGLRTQLERLKPKTKKKGRKKKGATPEVDEWEVVEDDLKPWMVQKWCEDHSICCLWKEGLRGGVKARY